MFMLNSMNIKVPNSISYFWQFGSLLLIFMILQIVSGILLIINYNNNESMAFLWCIDLWSDFNFSWLIHNLHANGASFCFAFIFLHMGRGLYFKSYKHNHLAWLSGVSLLLLMMMTAFLGYVLPWGQMSYWGTTVITSLLSIMPYVGNDILKFIWGDILIGQMTLSRFMSLHFLMPFVMLIFMMLHTLFLHKTLSSSPLKTNNLTYIKFMNLFTVKDVYVFVGLFLLFNIFNLYMPYLFGDVENFNKSNPLKTPLHIQPEWYFLFAYSILRSVPNKTGGVLMLVASVVFFYFFIYKKKSNKLANLVLFSSFMVLTFTGAMPVDSPFTEISKTFSTLYFISMLF